MGWHASFGSKRALRPSSRIHPGGTALPIGAHYAHVIISQDMGLHGLIKGTQALALPSWAGQSELPPPFRESWDQWARRTKFHLSVLGEYALAVYRPSDEYFASLTD